MYTLIQSWIRTFNFDRRRQLVVQLRHFNFIRNEVVFVSFNAGFEYKVIYMCSFYQTQKAVKIQEKWIFCSKFDTFYRISPSHKWLDSGQVIICYEISKWQCNWQSLTGDDNYQNMFLRLNFWQCALYWKNIIPIMTTLSRKIHQNGSTDRQVFSRKFLKQFTNYCGYVLTNS